MRCTEKELELIEVLKKYGSRKNLQKKRGALYDKLRNTGRTDILDAALPSLRITWTLELCQESAKKYKTRKEWVTRDNKVYSYARNKGWLEQCCSHMSKNARLRPVYCFETRKTYASASEAARKLKIQKGNISTQIKGKVKTVGGYTFKYADT